jgi:BirA family biotin operon repressor/biotin-[acetyl-CoA-carboxylase] ligase
LKEGDPPPQTLSLAAGLALIEAIDGALSAQPLMLKWPNDLMLSGKKLGGILLERNGDRVAVGIGVNLAAAPRLPDRELRSSGGGLPRGLRTTDRGSFAKLLALWRSAESSAAGAAWQERRISRARGSRCTSARTRH